MSFEISMTYSANSPDRTATYIILNAENNESFSFKTSYLFANEWMESSQIKLKEKFAELKKEHKAEQDRIKQEKSLRAKEEAQARKEREAIEEAARLEREAKNVATWAF